MCHVTLLVGVPLYSVTNWLSLGSIRPCENGNVFYLSRDHDIEVSRDFVGGVLSS